ncbi:putative NADH-flavin reductase [Herbihabitans rhizosphaerae]|uniref:Putative NADH-flavin reductase n=1 Tax=Herbihabitans rhizosphaerae TaxID=1872711 RepID=A0A4Q7L6Q7_9PSEU|nr:NAD(P)H-binding protein [Herbihabitans rhizosphaerae]RZS45004.1 putative NADH-flavin reductase [Herbihabitans rhizosphaerae]
MKITVFGATGGTGTELVRQALDADHQVTAVVRDPARLEIGERTGLDVVTADVMDPESIEPTVAGRDAVVFAIGARGRGPTTVAQDAANSIVTAMRGASVRRFVVVSAAGIHTTGDDPVTRFVAKPILNAVLRHPFADMKVMETVVRGSGLDWTLVCPPRLTDGKRTGTVHRNTRRNVRGRFSISRADLADCLLATITDDSLVRQQVSVAGGIW